MIDEILGSSTTEMVETSNNSALIGQFSRFFFHPWHFIQKETDGTSWKTETRHPIQPANLWHYWQDANTIVGIRFGQQTRYALLDIDRESFYHPRNDPAALGKIREALETIGIYRTVLIRSSESEGLHLYIPFSELLPTFDVAQSISYALTSSNLTIAAGTLEVFPNAKRYNLDRPNNYNGHRLPLQRGSVLLNNDCEPITADISFFLEVMELASGGNDNTELINSFVIAKEHARKSNFTKAGEPKGYRGRLWKLDCERVIELGWTAYHQTNQILGVIAQYGRVFKGLADQALELFVYETAIACPGYSDFCRHQSEISQRCKDWAHSAQKAYTPYAGDKTGNAWAEQKERARNAHNDDQAESALDRIKSAIAELGDRIFTTVREKAAEIAQLAKCSIATLYKHQSLWEGCNAQNEPLEPDTAIDQKVMDSDLESPETPPSGLLHPKSVYEGDRPPENNLTSSPNLEIDPEQDFFSNERTPRERRNCENPQKPP